jgi:ATP-dependent RNA helicase DHX29
MAESPLPEIMRLSLSDLALKIKILKVNLGASIGDVLSRALDPPMAINIQRAVSMLVEVSHAFERSYFYYSLYRRSKR